VSSEFIPFISQKVTDYLKGSGGLAGARVDESIPEYNSKPGGATSQGGSANPPPPLYDLDAPPPGGNPPGPLYDLDGAHTGESSSSHSSKRDPEERWKACSVCGIVGASVGGMIPMGTMMMVVFPLADISDKFWSTCQGMTGFGLALTMVLLQWPATIMACIVTAAYLWIKPRVKRVVLSVAGALAGISVLLGMVAAFGFMGVRGSHKFSYVVPKQHDLLEVNCIKEVEMTSELVQWFNDTFAKRKYAPTVEGYLKARKTTAQILTICSFSVFLGGSLIFVVSLLYLRWEHRKWHY
jgi:hypothetical protein